MKLFINVCVATLIFMWAYNSEAVPQRTPGQRPPNYPNDKRRPPLRPKRVRREDAKITNTQSVTGSLAPNLAGGANLNVGVSVGKIIEKEDHGHVIAFNAEASRNTRGGSIKNDIGISYKNEKFDAAISRSQLPGVNEEFTKRAHLNFFNNGENRLDGSVYKTDTKLGNGLEYEKLGGTLSFANKNGHRITLEKETIPGIRDTFTQKAHLNFFNSGPHKIDLSAHHSLVKLPNFDTHYTGANIDWSHYDDYGANIGWQKEPIGDQLTFGGYGNLYKSQDGLTSLDASVSGSKWLNGPLGGQKDFSFNTVLSHEF